MSLRTVPPYTPNHLDRAAHTDHTDKSPYHGVSNSTEMDLPLYTFWTCIRALTPPFCNEQTKNAGACLLEKTDSDETCVLSNVLFTRRGDVAGIRPALRADYYPGGPEASAVALQHRHLLSIPLDSSGGENVLAPVAGLWEGPVLFTRPAAGGRE